MYPKRNLGVGSIVHFLRHLPKVKLSLGLPKGKLVLMYYATMLLFLVAFIVVVLMRYPWGLSGEC